MQILYDQDQSYLEESWARRGPFKTLWGLGLGPTAAGSELELLSLPPSRENSALIFPFLRGGAGAILSFLLVGCLVAWFWVTNEGPKVSALTLVEASVGRMLLFFPF